MYHGKGNILCTCSHLFGHNNINDNIKIACLRTIAGLFWRYLPCMHQAQRASTLAFCLESSRQQYETIFFFALLQIQGVVAGEVNVLTFSAAGLPMGQHELWGRTGLSSGSPCKYSLRSSVSSGRMWERWASVFAWYRIMSSQAFSWLAKMADHPTTYFIWMSSQCLGQPFADCKRKVKVAIHLGYASWIIWMDPCGVQGRIGNKPLSRDWNRCRLWLDLLVWFLSISEWLALWAVEVWQLFYNYRGDNIEGHYNPEMLSQLHRLRPYRMTPRSARVVACDQADCSVGHINLPNLLLGLEKSLVDIIFWSCFFFAGHIKINRQDM